MKTLLSLFLLLISLPISYGATQGVSFDSSTKVVKQTDLKQTFATITNSAATASEIAGYDANKKLGSLTASATRALLSVPVFDLTDPGAVNIFPFWDDAQNEVDWTSNTALRTLLGIDSNDAVTFGAVTGDSFTAGPTNMVGALAGKAALSHSHAASDTTSGVFATARLASSGTANSSTFLRGDQTWATPAGSGDVVGPSSSTNNNLVRFDGTTGKLIQDGDAVMDDDGNIATPGSVTASSFLSTSTDEFVMYVKERAADATTPTNDIVAIYAVGGLWYGRDASGTVTKLSNEAGSGAPTDATYLTATAEGGLSAESNLGALTTGLLKITVSAGTATPSTATASTDYADPATTMTVAGTSLDIASSAGAQSLAANRTWTLTLDRTATLAGNPALSANHAAFATTGLIFEGTTADNFEGLITWPITASDKTVTMPDADTFVPILSQTLTISGMTAARTITVPDANFTVARTDAANTFTGVQTMTAPVFVTKVQLPTAAGTSTLSTGGDAAVNTTDKLLGVHNGTKEVAIPLVYSKEIAFDPDAVCDGAVDRVFLFKVGSWAPKGITITGWRLSFEADPTTEVDLDLKRADAFIGVANSAVMDVLDTTAGVSSETTAANINSGAVVANGKVVYLEFGTAYTETTHQIIFELEFEVEED